MKYYQSDYFNENIFSTDYAFLANVISQKYKPSTIIEFGCGPGYLARELASLNIKVDALDGFSDPDFSNDPLITFSKVNLDDAVEVEQFLGTNKYDMAICTEVAEHLKPESSVHLIKYLTQSAPVVIFSAAVPNQNGHGHINCQSRVYWHQLFRKNGFQIVDCLRKTLHENENLAIWYKLNVIDYTLHINSNLDTEQIINNLISSESKVSSLYYQKNSENEVAKAYLNYLPVRLYFKFRNLIKKMYRRKNG